MPSWVWTLIYIVGVLCCIWCVVDVWKHKVGVIWKIILTILLLCCSWIGLLVYYLIVRNLLK